MYKVGGAILFTWILDGRVVVRIVILVNYKGQLMMIQEEAPDNY